MNIREFNYVYSFFFELPYMYRHRCLTCGIYNCFHGVVELFAGYYWNVNGKRIPKYSAVEGKGGRVMCEAVKLYTRKPYNQYSSCNLKLHPTPQQARSTFFSVYIDYIDIFYKNLFIIRFFFPISIHHKTNSKYVNQFFVLPIPFHKHKQFK